MTNVNATIWANAHPMVRLASIQVAMGKRVDDVVRRYELSEDQAQTIPEVVSAYNCHPNFEGWLKTTGWEPKPWGGIEGTDSLAAE